MKLCEIYDFLDSEIQVDGQEKWDNSGFLVGDPNKEVSTVVISLDVSAHAVRYAKKVKAGLIISHHPVIFDPIKEVRKGSVPYELVKNDIGAFCFHTCLDVAEHGMNEILYSMLERRLYLGKMKIFDVTQPDGRGFGFTARSDFEGSLKEVAINAGRILKCDAVRFYDSGRPVQKICVVSGSGASMLEKAYDKGVDTFITGDVKHDRWIAAQNMGINLIDCGHYYTENVCLEYLHVILNEEFPELKIFDFEEPPYRTI